MIAFSTAMNKVRNLQYKYKQIGIIILDVLTAALN